MTCFPRTCIGGLPGPLSPPSLLSVPCLLPGQSSHVHVLALSLPSTHRFLSGSGTCAATVFRGPLGPQQQTRSYFLKEKVPRLTAGRLLTLLH